MNKIVACGLTDALGSALADLGHDVVAVAPSATRDDAISSLAALASFAAVVHMPTVEPMLEDRLLVDTDEDAWDRGAEAPIRTALVTAQAAYAALAGNGGSIVLLVPSIGITGAAGLVPFASAAEGIRLLAKSSARAWGADGVRINCVTLPIEQWGHEPPEGHDVPNRFGPALPDSDVVADAAGAISFLAGDLSRGLTGATIPVDRATVMAP